MGFLLLACLGSVWLAGATAVPSLFAHSHLSPDSSAVDNATAFLDWISNSTDSVASVCRIVLAIFSGGR
jgi:hypothetical protein